MRNNYHQSGIAPIVIVLIIGAIAILGGGGYFLFSGGSMSGSAAPASPSPAAGQPGRADVSSAPSSDGTAAAAEIPVGDTTGTIDTLLSRGLNVECDIKNMQNDERPFTGKLWGSATKGRSQIVTTIGPGIQVEANGIYKDDMAYIWSIMNGSVIMSSKISRSEGERASATMTEEQKQQAQQIRQEMVFNCKPWVPDATKFDLPAGITFTEMNISP